MVHHAPYSPGCNHHTMLCVQMSINKKNNAESCALSVAYYIATKESDFLTLHKRICLKITLSEKHSLHMNTDSVVLQTQTKGMI